jgi:phosphoribosylamine---glycine ligase
MIESHSNDFPSSRQDLKVLIVGNGGREHALAWKIAQSKHVAEVFCAPGNGGTAFTDKTTNVPISAMAFDELASFAVTEKIDLVVIGPDNPLAEGIVDHLKVHGLRVFGPDKQAAKLEWSKVHAKSFMREHGIPTPNYVVVSKLSEAKNIFKSNPWARVVKVDGLALGKGVYVCDSEEEVVAACQEVFEQNRFGEAGKIALLEERLVGEELSLLMLCDGKTLLPLASSQDHKRRFDHDGGPNTGGMGAYSPVPLFEKHEKAIEEKILAPIRKALSNGSLEFEGVLYAGIMIAKNNGSETPFVLEFNARFGDPETQALLPRLESDFLPALWSCTNGTLENISLKWKSDASCCVVAVTETYPEHSASGSLIKFGEMPRNCLLFHSGTRKDGDKVVTAGGRILSVTGLGATVTAAADAAYKALGSITFDGIDYRHDIAKERSLCH